MDDLAVLVEQEGGTALRWPDAFEPGEFVLTSLLRASREVDGGLVVAHTDDRTNSRSRLRWAPRDNVILELGILLSSLGRERAALVLVTSEKGEIKLPTDLDGLVHLKLDPRMPAANARRMREWMSRFFVSDHGLAPRLPSPTGGRYSWSDVIRGVEHIQRRLEKDGFAPDVVIGLGRSGGVVGGLLASLLGSIPFRVIDIEYVEGDNALDVRFQKPMLDLPKGAKRALVVEGATTGGTTPSAAQRLLRTQFPGLEIRFGILIQGATSHFRADYYAYLESGALAPLPWHGPLSRTFLTPSAPKAVSG